MLRSIPIPNTRAGVQAVNQSRESRQKWFEEAHKIAQSSVKALDNLTDPEKAEQGCLLFLSGYTIRRVMAECGPENKNFPDSPFDNKFLDWILDRKLKMTPGGKYLCIITAVCASDLAQVYADEVPDILEAITSIEFEKSPHLQQVWKDILSTYSLGSTQKPSSMSFETLADALKKPLDFAINKDFPKQLIPDKDDRRQIALIGILNGGQGLLKQGFLGLLHKALTTKKLENYLITAANNALTKDAKDKKESRQFEIPESELEGKMLRDGNLVRAEEDEEPDKISFFERIPAPPKENFETQFEILCQSFGFTERQREVLLQCYDGKTQKDIAAMQGRSHQAVNKDLKLMRAKARNLDNQKRLQEQLISPYREDGSLAADPTRRILDLTACEAVVSIIVEKIIKLTQL